MSLKNLFARLFRHDQARPSVLNSNVVKDFTPEPDPSSERSDVFQTSHGINAPNIAVSFDYRSRAVDGSSAKPQVAEALQISAATNGDLTGVPEDGHGWMTHSLAGGSNLSIPGAVASSLGALLERMEPSDEQSTDASINAAINTLRSAYHTLPQSLPIDYSDLATQIAYVYGYLPVRANLVFRVLDTCAEIKQVFARGKVAITSIGGGPGTDLLGVAKYAASKSSHTTAIRYQTYDKEPNWHTSLAEIWCKAGTPIAPPVVRHADMMDESTWSSLASARGTDVYIMSYCISEVSHDQKMTGQLIDYLASISPAAYFIFVDTKGSPIFKWSETVFAHHGFQVLSEFDRSRDWGLPGDEDERLSALFPRNWKGANKSPRAAWWVCRR